jgi:hypothetical protein
MQKAEKLAFQPTEIYGPGYQGWNTWEIVATGVTPLADVLKPETFAHVCNRLRPLDTIKVKSETHLFSVELEVVKIFVGGVVTRVVRKWEADAPDKSALKDTGLKVEWGGPSHKYRIVRTETGEVMKFGFPSQAEADAAVPEVVASMKA